MSNSETLGVWYSDAEDLALSLLWLRQWRWNSRTISTQASLSLEQANRQVDARVDAIERQLELLAAKAKSLGSRFSDVWPGLKLAYCDLGDFNHEGLPSTRCAWPSLQSLTERVLMWGWLLASEQQKRTLNCGEQCEFMEREKWLSKAVDAIRARLLLEESKLLQLNPRSMPAIEKPKKKTSGGAPRKYPEQTLAQFSQWWAEYRNQCGNERPTISEFLEWGEDNATANFPCSEEEVKLLKRAESYRKRLAQ